MSENHTIIYDIIKGIKLNGEFEGSIISKCRNSSLIFSDNAVIDGDTIQVKNGFEVGFKLDFNKKIAYSTKMDFNTTFDELDLKYSVLIHQETMDQYDEGQFSDAFPFTLNLLHTAGLFLNDFKYSIDHLDFFKGEILKNPVASITNGICVADRVVIDQNGDPVFYDCLIVGRDRNDDLNVSYEPLVFVDDKVVEFIIILGFESLKE